MSDQRILLEGVSFHVNGKSLVADIDVTGGEGELIGVIGPNGAGKSTLLSLVGGRLAPTRGTVTLMGRETGSVTPVELATMRSMLSRPMMGAVPYTARTIIETGRNPHRRAPGNTRERDREMVERALRATRTASMASRVYSTLSSGEQARVQIARILAQDAPIALLDEPTASLDVANTELALSTLARGMSERHTTICVLHDLNAAAYYASRLVLMARGRVVADGAPEDVLDADRLSEVYGQRMEVVDHPFRDCPLVLLGSTP